MGPRSPHTHNALAPICEPALICKPALIKAHTRALEYHLRSLQRMSTFSEEVRRSLDEADKAKGDVQHALGYFRRLQQLDQDDRDSSRAKIQRLEEEVSSLQRRIESLEEEKRALAEDKATLSEANRNVLGQVCHSRAAPLPCSSSQPHRFLVFLPPRRSSHRCLNTDGQCEKVWLSKGWQPRSPPT